MTHRRLFGLVFTAAILTLAGYGLATVPPRDSGDTGNADTGEYRSWSLMPFFIREIDIPGQKRTRSTP